MGLAARVATAAGITTTHIGSLVLISAADADVFLVTARNQGLAILGIEGFRVADGRATPDVNAIADFSDLPVDERLVDTAYEEARHFLREVSDVDMYFDFVVQAVEEPRP